jgi:hypothetical protein
MEQNNILMFLLATPVQFIVGWTFCVGTYKGLRLDNKVWWAVAYFDFNHFFHL